MLEQAYTDSNTNASSTENDGIVFEKSKLFDQISNNEDQLYKTNSTELLFQNEADTKDTLDYQLEVGSGNNKYTIKVTGGQKLTVTTLNSNTAKARVQLTGGLLLLSTPSMPCIKHSSKDLAKTDLLQHLTLSHTLFV